MKQLFLPLLGIVVFILSFTNSKKTFIPPGTIQINDTLFADETEISNFGWLEYIWWNEYVYGKDSKEYKECLPDTTVWREKLAYNEPYVSYYLRHIVYRDYPVVGVSYEQAQAFCKWRTDRVKLFLTRKKDFIHHNFEYRLPTKSEWERLAESSSNVLYNNSKDEKGNYQLNCIHPDTITTKSPPYADVTTPVNSYQKNFIGLFNMLGNVSEMVSEKGICKGGSWRSMPEQCRIGKEETYDKPTAWIGFRCVCIVKNSKNS